MKFWSGICVIFFLAAASPAAARVIQIEVSNLAYMPAKVSAHVGDTLEWINKDFVVHTATAKGGQWNIMLPVHEKGKTVLRKAGHIDYYCTYHPTMEGSIDVKP